MGGVKQKKVQVFKKKKKIPEQKIIADLQARYENVDESKIKKFTDLPLSSKTLKALKDNDYLVPTDIQKQSIALALRGNDILGAAKTGSGKTLAFLIPVLEILYCKQWTRMDHLGALIITPTRELAYQIYATLLKVGHYHDFSVGLIIGGKDLMFEKKRLDQCNIIICTPGRILQHMDENPLFDSFTMQVLVLDEADRCLDMGFAATMNAIIANLPPTRQTLLFSATQTKSVRDLARLSLKNPLYVSVHEHAEHATPEGLQQNYVMCNLGDKVAMLWSFIKHHLKQKVIVFFTTCKQVKYTYELFRRMRPGISLLALYGSLSQLKRMSIYDSFSKKQNVVLFATDIASRGLDFPAVSWVIQMDCPEDVNAYIHRVGRTARFRNGGNSLLVLSPREEKMIERLTERKIPISMIKVNPANLNNPQGKIEALVASDVALKEMAQRAFVCYVKSVFFMKDKDIFDVHSIDAESYAKSLGLAIPPRIRFLQRMQSKEAKRSEISDGTTGKLVESIELSRKSHDDDSSDESGVEVSSNKSRKQVPSKEPKSPVDSVPFANDDSDDNEDILTIKRKNVQIEGVISEEESEKIPPQSSKNKKPITKVAVAKKILRKKIVANKKTYFDNEGQTILDAAKTKLSELGREYDEQDESSGLNIEMAKKVLREEDRFDKKRYQEKIKLKHKEKKRKLKAKKKEAAGEADETEDDDELEGGVQLADYSSEGEAEEPDLSWLPDPDKIYGPKKGSDESHSSHSDGSDEDEDQYVHRPPKRKLVTRKDMKKSKKKQKLEISDNSDLQVAEDMALALLRA